MNILLIDVIIDFIFTFNFIRSVVYVNKIIRTTVSLYLVFIPFIELKKVDNSTSKAKFSIILMVSSEQSSWINSRCIRLSRERVVTFWLIFHWTWTICYYSLPATLSLKIDGKSIVVKRFFLLNRVKFRNDYAKISLICIFNMISNIVWYVLTRY